MFTNWITKKKRRNRQIEPAFLAGRVANSFFVMPNAADNSNVAPVAHDMLVESVNDGVLVLDTAGRVVDINPAAQRMLAVDTSSAIGQIVDALLPGWSRDGEDRQQKTIVRGNPLRYFDVRIMELADRKGTKRGQLVILWDITTQKKLETEREELIRNLQDALARVKTLSGLLPICAYCNKIRDDEGYWHRIEAYIQEHSEAVFSHGVCPECLKKLCPKEVWEDTNR